MVNRIVKGKTRSAERSFKIFAGQRQEDWTAINTLNIHSRPEISGMLMAAAMYINLVKGCTLVR